MSVTTARVGLYRRFGTGVDVADLVLDEWDGANGSLSAAVSHLDHLVIADPLSFPYESVEIDIPVTVVVPGSIPIEDVVTLYGHRLATLITPLDRIVASDEAWAALARANRWLPRQRLPLGRRDLAGMVEAARDRHAQSLADERRRYVAVREALAPEVEVGFAGCPLATLPSAVVVGPSAGSWASVTVGSDLSVRFLGDGEAPVGLEASTRAVGAALCLGVPDRSADVVVSTFALSHVSSRTERRRLLSGMWRATRDAIVVVDRMVGPYADDPGVVPTSMLISDILDATAGRVVLGGARSVADPVTGRRTIGVVRVHKIDGEGFRG